MIFKIKKAKRKEQFANVLRQKTDWTFAASRKNEKKCDDDKTFFQWKREIDNSFEENQKSIDYQ
jgi:hypothetical protein